VARRQALDGELAGLRTRALEVARGREAARLQVAHGR
jgi:hypothetical protein